MGVLGATAGDYRVRRGSWTAKELELEARAVDEGTKSSPTHPIKNQCAADREDKLRSPNPVIWITLKARRSFRRRREPRLRGLRRRPSCRSRAGDAAQWEDGAPPSNPPKQYSFLSKNPLPDLPVQNGPRHRLTTSAPGTRFEFVVYLALGLAAILAVAELVWVVVTVERQTPQLTQALFPVTPPGIAPNFDAGLRTATNRMDPASSTSGSAPDFPDIGTRALPGRCL